MTKVSHDVQTGEVFAHLRVFTEKTRRRPVVPKGTPRVKSEFKDQCDINRIVARIKKTGDQSGLNLDRPWQGLDTSELPTNYTDALMLTIQVRDRFMELSAVDRQKFNNDPQQWIDDLENKRKASYEAAKATQEAANKEAAEEAAYRKKRREAPPASQDSSKINK